MDQYGLLLSDLLPNSSIVNKLESLQEALGSGKIPIFLPSTFLFAENTLPNSWDVTSDSIAVFIAWQLHASRTILVTDVDGVCTSDPKKSSEAKLIRKLPALDLLRMHERTSVDKFLPTLLLQLKTECFVVNGLHPERVQDILKGQDTVCTLITRQALNCVSCGFSKEEIGDCRNSIFCQRKNRKKKIGSYAIRFFSYPRLLGRFCHSTCKEQS